MSVAFLHGRVIRGFLLDFLNIIRLPNFVQAEKVRIGLYTFLVLIGRRSLHPKIICAYCRIFLVHVVCGGIGPVLCDVIRQRVPGDRLSVRQWAPEPAHGAASVLGDH